MRPYAVLHRTRIRYGRASGWSLRWRMSTPSIRKTTDSAIFLAWSAMRSMALLIVTRWTRASGLLVFYPPYLYLRDLRVEYHNPLREVCFPIANR